MTKGYKVGDEVYVDSDHYQGVASVVVTDGFVLGVDCGEKLDWPDHDCDGNAKHGQGLWVSEDEVRPLTKDSKDVINHPDHYNNGGIECIDYLKDNMSWEAYKGYLEGNTKKYLHRWRYKSKPIEDLKKARWYLDRLIHELTTEGSD